MKAFLASTTILFASTLALAADPTPAPAPSPTLVGTWSLAANECSSGTPLSGGVKIGQDTMKGTFNDDMSFTTTANISGCGMTSKGTYSLDGSILTMTMTEGQTCKDAAPVPANHTSKMYLAYLDAASAVTIATGVDAEMHCPAGDALISRYSKEIVNP